MIGIDIGLARYRNLIVIKVGNSRLWLAVVLRGPRETMPSIGSLWRGHLRMTDWARALNRP